MSGTSADEFDIVQLLRAWAETGAVGELASRYSKDAELDALVPGRRVHCEGVAAIVAELRSWWSGPARVPELTVFSTPKETVSVDIERHPVDSAAPSRLNHVIRCADGAIVRHLVISGRPHHVGLPELSMPLTGLRERRRHSGSGASGSIVELVDTHHGRFAVKHSSSTRDWLMRATHDRGREAALFREGVFADLPDSLLVPIVAAEREGDGWVIVMHDVSDHLHGSERNLTRTEGRRLFAALSEMHRHFEDRNLPDALTRLTDRINACSTHVVASEKNGADRLPKWFQRSWELLETLVPRDVAAIARDIDHDPTPIANALLTRGRTLLHGDAGPSNVGFNGNQVVLIDWQLATVGPGVFDLVCVLNHANRFDATRDELLDDVRAAAGRNHDELTLQLAILANVPFACALWATGAVEDVDPQWRAEAASALDWWVGAARRAAAYTRWS
jgi:thiamine kinase-like enzyme